MQAHYTEKKLVLRVQEYKDTEAFGKLYDLYIQKIYRFVFLKVSHKEEAEDITSEVFLKTWNYLTEKKDTRIDSFSGLIYRIARNTLVDFYRKKNSRVEYSLTMFDDIGDRGSFVRAVDTNQEIADVFTALKQVKQEYQEIIFLKYIEELSIAEISEILGKKSINVRVTLHRGMNILKKILSERENIY
ncbi:MAG: RNA polymerase sigma factor [Candidatus Magasanikbacteria bacterium]|nr:RNA polymerase sigma factor [Candidatus Magasanikbacteria bacterium]